ncbi:hypothetical protein GDO81_020889 [Engystomops pustulosus]|uniref:Secreted protein n=1 Tax=Engystomops pustulosus TaxID=76066 RepID=A0AAV6YRZ4_ENGPU|nr:hypothetical protein GDO81_020908 [Engystomops pustulosus]KAG8539459.1 hypothetical protein GDO81_020889 [Engystomops pustulosus]
MGVLICAMRPLLALYNIAVTNYICGHRVTKMSNLYYLKRYAQKSLDPVPHVFLICESSTKSSYSQLVY